VPGLNSRCVRGISPSLSLSPLLLLHSPLRGETRVSSGQPSNIRNSVTTTYDGPNVLGRATLRATRSRRIMRAAIHFLSYHFILNSRRTTHAHVAGFRLIVRPMVFHPRYFLTSAFFARFLLKLDLSGKRIADVGTGSGILALAAWRPKEWPAYGAPRPKPLGARANSPD
jgi:methylase of polypeptide subunit release factors